MTSSYLIKRIFFIIPTLFIIVTFSFFLIRFAPGSPFTDEKAIDQLTENHLLEKYHLNKTLYEQYFIYLKSIAQGDLGPSLKYHDWSVNQLVFQGLSTSLKIGLSALSISLFFGIMLGIISVLKQRSILDSVIKGFNILGVSLPNFVIAPFLTLIFSVTFNWLPAGALDHGIKSYILPVIALSLPQIAIISRMVHASMQEVLLQDYIKTAIAKGLSPYKVAFKHGMPEAMLPIISYLGPTAASILTGSMVIEQIFNLPGLGFYLIKGALNRDYTLVLGGVLVIGVTVIILNLFVDILYCYVNRKIKY
ncbi:MAG: ABC transporter permease subunit [Silvanigrellaceae bacterium]|nr:ABC transporter permease subunit [Silvanigrellaceae bacterium]